MTSAGFEVQKAVHSALVADAEVVSAVGGGRIYDDVPRGAAYPYVTFGQTTERDWSTGSEDGSEHTLTLHVWSRMPGRQEAQSIVAAMRGALHDAPLSLAGGHRLVNLRHEYSDIVRDSEGETYHGIVRYRAVTELV